MDLWVDPSAWKSMQPFRTLDLKDNEVWKRIQHFEGWRQKVVMACGTVSEAFRNFAK